jgi:hypothetical protein
MDCDSEDEGIEMLQNLGTFLHSVRDQYPSRLVTLPLLLFRASLLAHTEFLYKN